MRDDNCFQGFNIKKNMVRKKAKLDIPKFFFCGGGHLTKKNRLLKKGEKYIAT